MRQYELVSVAKTPTSLELSYCTRCAIPRSFPTERALLVEANGLARRQNGGGLTEESLFDAVSLSLESVTSSQLTNHNPLALGGSGPLRRRRQCECVICRSGAPHRRACGLECRGLAVVGRSRPCCLTRRFLNIVCVFKYVYDENIIVQR